MRQILTYSFLIFCTSLAFSQKTITKDQFDSFVDYANCKYVAAFIEMHDGNNEAYIETYRNKLQGELQSASLENLGGIPGYQYLTERLSNNVLAQELVNKINGRKDGFDSFQDDQSLIGSLHSPEWEGIDLKQTASEIQSEISAFLGLNESNRQDSRPDLSSDQLSEIQARLKKLEGEYVNLQNKLENNPNQKSPDLVQIIVISIIASLIILLLAIAILVPTKVLRTYIIEQVLGSRRFDNRLNAEARNDYWSTKKPKETGNSGYVVKEPEVELEQKKKLDTQPQQEPEEERKESIKPPAPPPPKYLSGQQGKVFNLVGLSSRNSFFKLVNEKGDKAEFEFSGSEEEAIAKRIFSDDICRIIAGSYQNASSVRTKNPGKLKRKGETWEVTDPIEIELT